MAAAAPIFTAAGAAVPCSAFRRGAGRHAAAREAAARELSGVVGDGLKAKEARAKSVVTTAAENAPLPIAPPPLTRRVLAEYLYLGGSGTDMRSVTRVVEVPRGEDGAAAAASSPPDASVVAALPLIAVDGAATRQAGGGGNSNNAALFLKPRSAWLDPLRGGGALLVLCEAYSPPALGGGSCDAKFVCPSTPLPTPTTENSTHHPALSPHPTNNRAFAERAARAAGREEPLFAVTQQYLLCEGDGTPLGWTADGPPQASCYGSPDGSAAEGFFLWNETGIGTGIASSTNPPPNSFSASASASASTRGRAVADSHLAACLAAGLAVTGCRAEQACGQWSFSLGPLPPLDAADQLWAARWLLRAVAGGDRSRLVAVTDALPRHLSKFEGRWDGNGCRVKFSTRATRDASGGGRGALRDAIERLAAAHASHMMVYGAGAALRCEKAGERLRLRLGRSEGRVTANEESSPPPSPTTPTEGASLDPSSPPSPSPPASHQQQQQRFAGVEDTGALLRIPAAVALHGRGHLEDRRPAGGCDPYMAITLLLCTTLGLPLPLSPAAAKRARCCGDEQEGDALLAPRRKEQRVAPLASAAASGSGENRCRPNRNANTNANANNTNAAASLACDEQVAESAQEGEEEEEDAAAAAAAAVVETSDLNLSGGDGVRSSALLLAEDDDGDDDEGVSTPLTPTRDAATTVAGPDNRREASSRRSGDLDDDATSSSSNGGT